MSDRDKTKIIDTVQGPEYDRDAYGTKRQADYQNEARLKRGKIKTGSDQIAKLGYVRIDPESIPKSNQDQFIDNGSRNKSNPSRTASAYNRKKFGRRK
jgi:hypothetical protein